MIDIGCYAHLRKLANKMVEIDLSEAAAQEKIRSAPVFSEKDIHGAGQSLPSDIEQAVLSPGI